MFLNYFTDGDGIDEDRKAVAKEKKRRKKKQQRSPRRPHTILNS